MNVEVELTYKWRDKRRSAAPIVCLYHYVPCSSPSKLRSFCVAVKVRMLSGRARDYWISCTASCERALEVRVKFRSEMVLDEAQLAKEIFRVLVDGKYSCSGWVGFG